jgi:hypothetical protein
MTKAVQPTGYVRGGIIRRGFRRLAPRKFREDVWAAVMRTPLADLVVLLDPTTRGRRVTRSTQLIIEGYPRVGNTYARAAFEHANGPDTPVASHMHSYRSIQKGIRRRIPTIALVRAPDQVLGSLLQFNPTQEAEEALRNYSGFHRTLRTHVDDIIVADFAEVTSDFGSVIKRVNARYGTSFVPYVKTPESEEAVFAAIDSVSVAHDGHRFGAAVSRPSADRKNANDVLAGLDDAARTELGEAQAAYRALLDAAAEADRRLANR